MKNQLIYRSNVLHLKVRPSKFCIVYAKNCSIQIKEERSQDEAILPKGSISFIEKNLNLGIFITNESEGETYIVRTLDDDTVRELIKILAPVLKFIPKNISKERKLNDKIHSVKGDGINEIIFSSIKENNYAASDLYKLACLISKADKLEKLYWSLCVSASQYFSDRVKAVVESDLSKKWTLYSVSEALSLSEIAVRKKLESENTTFYQVLLDARMHKAAKLILNENHHINKVSSKVGVSSTSHFIKIFSLYYGTTPKQFYLHYKKIKT
ncbi:helix-turn-helix transcriptional regulator [Salmonella enterica subsp. enterica serovar Bredeney]|uniref:helix-turn-helix transcriptional regulator n=1 Tax=Salmonella enterica TaxID=28901 RepID=UPI0009AEDF7C|nr:helix-turn-helix transcriptional regulator [Salmonella enterica]EBW7049984.1 AraC family transcriptional regulator [Salmonella enterica subsp. enterica serovar Muenchen]ECI7782073.1 AraC family transcriptional regulator [Salmonella enterica subsp. enterica]EDV7203840.1 helix-turn-helix transcriptional regulator [Salmonella enterica subsp. enterica serovar Bredeney]EBI8251241.1 AraC family transcriptional regulator [Salmonella enterica]MLS47455.1 AraC family transcriptional regulator [Salmon